MTLGALEGDVLGAETDGPRLGLVEGIPCILMSKEYEFESKINFEKIRSLDFLNNVLK